MKNIFFLVAAICFAFISPNAFAQDEALINDYKAFVERTFETEFNAMSETASVDSYLKNFSQGVVGTIVNIGLDGKGKTEQVDAEHLKEQLVKLIGKGSIKIKWDITDLTYTTVKGKTGVCGFLITATYFRDGEVIKEITNVGRAVSTRQQDSWKVTYFSLISIEENVTRGNCYCDIYSQDQSNFLTQTYVPNGTSFELSTDNIVIGTFKGKRYIRLNAETVYYWNPTSGDITFDNVKIGTANGTSLAIKVILKHSNNDRCSSMKSRKSKEK